MLRHSVPHFEPDSGGIALRHDWPHKILHLLISQYQEYGRICENYCGAMGQHLTAKVMQVQSSLRVVYYISVFALID